MTSDQNQAMGTLFDRLDVLAYRFRELNRLGGVGKKTRQAGSGQELKETLETLFSLEWEHFEGDLEWVSELGVNPQSVAYMIEHAWSDPLTFNLVHRLPDVLQKFIKGE